MIYTIQVNTETREQLVTSLFQIPEDYRAALAKIAAVIDAEGNKQSINTCIVNALENYLDLPNDTQLQPVLPKVPLRAFTVRTSDDLKRKVRHCAALWQLKTFMPVSMNALVNTAILVYLKKHIPGYKPPF